MIQAFLDLHNLHKTFNAGQELLEETIGAPTCVAGCGKCCETNTPLCMTIEAINMVSAFHRDVADIAAEAEGWLLEKHNLSVYEGMPKGVMGPDLMAEWKMVSKSQCPFLLPDKRCRIHEERPLTCRAFGIYRDNQEANCPRPLGKGETRIRRAIIDGSVARPLVKQFQASCEARMPAWVVRGFVPTMFFRALYPEKLKAYIADNRIASAKLVGINIDIDLMWQPQLDALRRGVGPMEVVRRGLVGATA